MYLIMSILGSANEWGQAARKSDYGQLTAAKETMPQVKHNTTTWIVSLILNIKGIIQNMETKLN